MSTSNKRIKQFQALRTIACLGIVLGHLGFGFQWQCFGVSVFIVLSGFLSAYNFVENNYDFSIKNSLLYSLRRVSKIYLLYLLSNIYIYILYIFRDAILGIGFTNIKKYTIMLILNLLMVQSLIPSLDYTMALNGVSWFLSTMFFIWMLAPLLCKFCKKKHLKFLLLIIFFVILIQLAFGFIFSSIKTNNYNLFHYLTYCNPIFRLFDFIVGISIYYVTCCRYKKTVRFFNKYYISNSIYCLIILCVYLGNVYISKYTQYSSAFIIPTCLSIIVLYHKNVYSFGNFFKVLISIEKYSNIIYLVHIPIIITFEFYIGKSVQLMKNSSRLAILLIIYIFSVFIGYINKLYEQRKVKCQ